MRIQERDTIGKDTFVTGTRQSLKVAEGLTGTFIRHGICVILPYISASHYYIAFSFLSRCNYVLYCSGTLVFLRFHFL